MYQSKKMISILLVLVFILAGCGKTESIPELIEQDDTSYIELTATRRDLSSVNYCTGYVHAQQYEQCFHKAGMLDMFYVVAGDKVEKGDLLAKLICTDTENELDALKKQKVYSDRISDNGIAQKEILISLKEREINEMAENGDSEGKITLARLELEELKENLRYDTIRVQVEKDSRDERIAKLEEEENENYLYASESGIISYVQSIEETCDVSAYQTIMVISDEEERYVEPSTYVLVENVVDCAKIYAYVNGEKYDMDYRVEEALIEGEKKKCAVFTFQDSLKPELGYDAVIGIVKKSVENVVTIPEEGLNKNGNNYYVYMNNGKTREKVPVTIGMRYNGVVEIKSGVEEGQKVCSYETPVLVGADQEETVSYGSLEDVYEIKDFGNTFPIYKSAVNTEEDVTLAELYVANYKRVEKGDKLYKIRYKDENLEGLSIQNEMNQLEEDYEAQKVELQKSKRSVNLSDPSGNLQEQLISLQLEQLKEQYELNLLDCKTRYDEAMEHSGEKIITSPMDGILMNQTQAQINSTLGINQEMFTISTYSNDLLSIFELGTYVLQYGSEVKLVSGDMEYEARTIESATDKSFYSGGASSLDYSLSTVQFEGDVDFYDVVTGDTHLEYCPCRVDNGIVISTKYLFEEDDKSYVWVKENGYMEKRYVAIGKKLTDKTWIIDGLSEGETIVTNKEE